MWSNPASLALLTLLLCLSRVSGVVRSARSAFASAGASSTALGDDPSSDVASVPFLPFRSCPVVKMGKLCIEVLPTDKVAFISEDLCIGCGICSRK